MGCARCQFGATLGYCGATLGVLWGGVRVALWLLWGCFGATLRVLWATLGYFGARPCDEDLRF